MVLPARSGWGGAGSLDILQEQAWPFPESDLFRRVFESVLCRCIEERQVGGEGFAVDASLIKADAIRQKGIKGAKELRPDASGSAIDEYLAVLDDAAFGAATEITPKFVSPSDATTRWTGAHGGQAFPLLDELSGRHRERDHRRCQGDYGNSAGEGVGRRVHD
nr:hypothetical protein [Bradyrhizobium sp. Rc2d]